MSTAPAMDLLSPSLDVGIDDEAHEAAPEPTIRHLELILRERAYAIEIRHVLEIVVMQPLTPVHDAPPWVKGLMNLRGHVVPLVDASERIGLEPRPYDDRTCIIVLQIGDEEVGLVVDRVRRVIDLPRRVFEGESESKRQAHHVRGVWRDGDEVVVCLDPAWLTDAHARQPERPCVDPSTPDPSTPEEVES